MTKELERQEINQDCEEFNGIIGHGYHRYTI